MVVTWPNLWLYPLNLWNYPNQLPQPFETEEDYLAILDELKDPND